MNELHEMKARRRARYFGKRYWHSNQQDGTVELGVLRGDDSIWFVGYITESGSVRRYTSKWLEPTTHPAELQQQLDSWAIGRGLQEVS